MKIIRSNTKSNNDIKIKLINFKFLRFIFSPKNDDILKLSKKVSSLFKNKSNTILPREITWPINTNKQYFFSQIDIKMIEKLMKISKIKNVLIIGGDKITLGIIYL